jgi:tRNA G18 (ribose-2'-O)-methylase SpoU
MERLVRNLQLQAENLRAEQTRLHTRVESCNASASSEEIRGYVVVSNQSGKVVNLGPILRSSSAFGMVEVIVGKLQFL